MQNATLHIFADDAYVNEMGITNPTFPTENCPNGDCSGLQCLTAPELNDPDGGDVTVGPAENAYSDFLLHDMGALGDGITQGTATGTLMRTTPLWGVRVQTTLLHDGRATTVTAAIDAHAGQGTAACVAFEGLGATERSQLLAFLASL